MVKNPAHPAAREPAPAEAPPDEAEARQRPVHEIRLGRIKAAVWANPTDQGVRHAVTILRLYKREDTGEWHTASNFGRDDLPAVMKVAELAWLHIFALQQADGYSPS